MANLQAPFPAMTTSRDAPNPLRPYYVAPSIGPPPDAAANATTSAASRHGSIGNSARDIFSEFDYGGPLFDSDSPSVADIGKKIMDQALWKYTSVLLAQPFDVAKTILQVRLAAAADPDDLVRDRRRQSSRLSESSSHRVCLTPSVPNPHLTCSHAHSQSDTTRKQSLMKTNLLTSPLPDHHIMRNPRDTLAHGEEQHPHPLRRAPRYLLPPIPTSLFCAAPILSWTSLDSCGNTLAPPACGRPPMPLSYTTS